MLLENLIVFPEELLCFVIEFGFLDPGFLMCEIAKQRQSRVSVS